MNKQEHKVQIALGTLQKYEGFASYKKCNLKLWAVYTCYASSLEEAKEFFQVLYMQISEKDDVEYVLDFVSPVKG